MDFYTILDQIVDLLRHRQRVTYRVLQRQFNLDDAFLNDLKVELIEAQHLATDRATGGALSVPYLCTLLAEIYDHLGHTEDGLQTLTEAHTLMEQQEERWWEAEIYRLRGVLLLRQPGTPQAEAETSLQRALDVARRQEAKALELRAAMSLARLWQQQGKRAEARDLLGPIYGWFIEGFDTAHLQEARVLLDELM